MPTSTQHLTMTTAYTPTHSFHPTLKPLLVHMKCRALVAVVCLALTACGGGGGPTAAAPGTGGTGSFTTGPISGFGSVIINGVRYDDSSSNLRVQTEDDDTSDDDKGALGRDDLKLGMITQVEGGSVTAATTTGGLATATANTISLSNEIKGPVSRIDAAGNSLTVLQQTISVNAGTVYANVASLSAANPGTNCAYAEIYAYYNVSNSSYTATRVECKGATLPTGWSSFRIFGPASNVDLPNKNFKINLLTIDTSSLTNPPTVTDNDMVRVRLSTTLSGANAIATRLRVGSTNSDIRSDEAKQEGLVENFVSSAQFSVNGVRVVTNGSTEFETGAQAALANGKRVEVEGSLNNGVLTAREVKIEDDSDLENETSEFIGLVDEDADDPNTGGTFDLIGSGNRRFTVTFTTSDFDKPQDRDQFAPGQTVEVKGILGSDGFSLDATRIKIED
jgi:Domain of unknown function (DUF5666)